MDKYKCEYCPQKIHNIIEYVDHINDHKMKNAEINISTEILQYLIDHNIEPYQHKWQDSFGIFHLSFLRDFTNDADVLYMIIDEIDNELMALDILNLLNPKNIFLMREFDDDEKLREYLFNEKIINYVNCDLTTARNKYSYENWEKICNFTNNSLLMHCIKKKWNKFCMRLLDFHILYDINKKNITNAYEMAIKYELYNVAKKIKNDRQFNPKI